MKHFRPYLVKGFTVEMSDNTLKKLKVIRNPRAQVAEW